MADPNVHRKVSDFQDKSDLWISTIVAIFSLFPNYIHIRNWMAGIIVTSKDAQIKMLAHFYLASNAK